MYNKRISNIVVPMMGIGQMRGYAGLCRSGFVRILAVEFMDKVWHVL